MLDAEAQDKVRPLCWWSPAQLSQFAQYIRPVWARWLDDWVVDAKSTLRSVECGPACETPDLIERSWMSLGTSELAAAWLDSAQAGAMPIGVLFESQAGDRRSPGDSIAVALWREAHADLRQALCARLSLAPSDGAAGPEAEVFRPWIGGLIVSLGSKGDAGALRLLANAQTVGQVLRGSRPAAPAGATAARGPRGGLHSVEATLAGKLVQVRVQLAACELDLGTLSSLRVGDIVPLSQALDEPLTVALEDRPFCTGYLGRRGGAKAIELTRAAGGTPLTQFNSP